MGRRIADEVDVYGFMARENVKEGDVIFIDPLSGLEGLCRHFFFFLCFVSLSGKLVTPRLWARGPSWLSRDSLRHQTDLVQRSAFLYGTSASFCDGQTDMIGIVEIPGTK